MSKKYKGKTCVYCAQSLSTAPDHVFAREFFLSSDRGNLPQVPACDACNRTKARLEHHMTAVLPFGGRHPAAKTNLETLVPGRLAKNQKLHRALASGAKKAWIKEDALYQPTMSLPIEGSSFLDLFSLVVRGLVWFHWKALLTPKHLVNVLVLTDAGERYFDGIMNLEVADRVTVDLGSSTVQYEGVQGFDNPSITAWRISMYGGITFGDSGSPGLVGRRIGAITGPEDADLSSDPSRPLGVRLGA